LVRPASSLAADIGSPNLATSRQVQMSLPQLNSG
jgi:hypothetical protein